MRLNEVFETLFLGTSETPSKGPLSAKQIPRSPGVTDYYIKNRTFRPTFWLEFPKSGWNTSLRIPNSSRLYARHWSR